MGSMRELKTVPAAERAARTDLAAAFRLAVRLGLHEGVCNHFSLMLPGGRKFLLNRYGLHWSEVSASNLLALDAEGNVLDRLARALGEKRVLFLASHGVIASAHFEALKRLLEREEPGYSR